MAELKCPHCGQAFTVDDTELSSIVQQIRDKEFEKDIEKRISELKEHMLMTHRLEMEAKENEIKLMSQKEYDKEIQKLKSQLDKATEKSAKLQAQLESSEDKKIIAVMEAVKKVMIAGGMIFNIDFHSADMVAVIMGFIVLYFGVVAVLTDN